jgi:hypothetical protein
MKTLTAAALSLTIIGLSGPALAADWNEGISVKDSVTGYGQTVDRSTPWMNAVTARETLAGQPQSSDHGPFGFLAQAMDRNTSPGEPTGSSEVASK